MERNRVIRFVLFLITALLATGAIAAAQRTFVKSDGVDLGSPCSLVQPCRTFGAAMLLTNFGGDIVTLDSAGYGPVTITQPVSILVPSGVYAGVSVSGAQVDGIVVDIANGGGPVYLRGLQINGQGGTNGVRINRGGRVILESVSISGFYNGNAILDNSTSQYTELVLRNVVIRDGANGVVVDGTVGNKSVSIENSLISGFYNTACVSLTDSVNMVVSNTKIEGCNTGFALTQPGSSIGYMQLQMERTTLTRIGPNPAVKIVNNANDRAPNVAISDSHLFNTNGISVTNGGNVAIDRSTFDGCGPVACLDAGGTTGFVNFELSKTELRHAGRGIRMVVDGTMGGVINVADSRITDMWPNEAIYLRGNAVSGINLVAKGSTINGNKMGIVVGSYSGARLTTNQIVNNSGGGLFKSAGGVNQFIESSNDNYVTSNGWDPGSPPDAIPGNIQLR